MSRAHRTSTGNGHPDGWPAIEHFGPLPMRRATWKLEGLCLSIHRTGRTGRLSQELFEHLGNPSHVEFLHDPDSDWFAVRPVPDGRAPGAVLVGEGRDVSVSRLAGQFDTWAPGRATLIPVGIADRVGYFRRPRAGDMVETPGKQLRRAS